MTTNREWLYALDVADLTDWFDAEHVDDDGVSRSNDGVVAEHETDNTSNKSVENVTDSREQLESLMLEKLELQRKVDELTDSYEASCRALDILTLDKSNLETQLEAEHALVVQFQYDNERIKAERDNLADDLLACNREREQLRKHLGIALDHAHDICSLVDIDGNVLDVGD